MRQMLPFRLARLSQALTIDHGGRRLSVPTRPEYAARTWISWQWTWKTEIIARTLDSRDGAFVDVGANIGQTLQDFLACPRSGRYVGYEPLPECAAFVQAILDANSLERYSLIPTALAEEPEVVNLHLPEGDSASATMVDGLRPGRPERRAFVACTDFEHAWPFGDDPIALVKIDVEGGELDVMRGMTNALRQHHPHVLCEVLRPDDEADIEAYADRVNSLRNLLDELRYTPMQVEKDRGRFAGLSEVPRFPLERWTPENGEQCDYLFIAEGALMPNRPRAEPGVAPRQ